MIGFIIGLFVGAFIGVLIMCLCSAVSSANEDMERQNDIKSREDDMND